MTWEYRVSVIVMLTNLVEEGSSKAEVYWPRTAGKAVRYGDYIVLLKREEIKHSQLALRYFNYWCDPKPKKEVVNAEKSNSEDDDDILDLGSDSSDDFFDFTEMEITEPENAEVKTIVQIHCPKWPDLGVLHSLESIEEIIFEVDKYRSPDYNEPILVHCSAGIGRTGTFITIHSLLHRDKFGKEIDVKNMVLHLRSQRVGMVQSINQYIFIYQIISQMTNRYSN